MSWHYSIDSEALAVAPALSARNRVLSLSLLQVRTLPSRGDDVESSSRHELIQLPTIIKVRPLLGHDSESWPRGPPSRPGVTPRSAVRGPAPVALPEWPARPGPTRGSSKTHGGSEPHEDPPRASQPPPIIWNRQNRRGNSPGSPPWAYHMLPFCLPYPHRQHVAHITRNHMQLESSSRPSRPSGL